MAEERETEEDESRLDLYAVLELPRDASDEDIRLAFRKIAAKNHPDRNEGDTKAALRFKRANAAYQVLSDPEKKELYDQLTTPVEEIPAAPPAQALARQEDAKAWRHPEASREPSTRRVRRRVRRGRTSWTWGLVVGAAMVILVAWMLVPDASAVHAVVVPAAGPPSTALGDNGPSTRAPPDLLAAPPDRPTSPAGNARSNVSLESPPEVDVPVKTVTGDKWVFSVPTDWQSAGDAKTTVWKGPGAGEAGGATVSLVVSSFTGDSAAYFKSLERRTRGGKVVDTEAWESESQPDGLKREGRIVSGGKVTSKFVEYAVAVKGRGYELTCSASLVGFETAEPLCERILGSLQIK